MKKNGNDELRCRGFSGNLKAELKNVAANSGVTISALVKTQMRAFINSLPPEMRQARTGQS